MKNETESVTILAGNDIDIRKKSRVLVFCLCTGLIVCDEDLTPKQDNGGDKRSVVLNISGDGVSHKLDETTFWGDLIDGFTYAYANENYRIVLHFPGEQNMDIEFLLTVFESEVHYIGNLVTSSGASSFISNTSPVFIETERDDFLITECDFLGHCTGDFSGPVVHWEDDSITLDISGQFGQ